MASLREEANKFSNPKKKESYSSRPKAKDLFLIGLPSQEETGNMKDKELMEDVQITELKEKLEKQREWGSKHHHWNIELENMLNNYQKYQILQDNFHK